MRSAVMCVQFFDEFCRGGNGRGYDRVIHFGLGPADVASFEKRRVDSEAELVKTRKPKSSSYEQTGARVSTGPSDRKFLLTNPSLKLKADTVTNLSSNLSWTDQTSQSA